jgi:hypothetical protein
LFNENNVLLEVYGGACDNMILLDCDQFGGISGSEVVITDGIPGETIFIRAADQGSNTQGDFAMCVMSEKPDDIVGSKEVTTANILEQQQLERQDLVDVQIYPNPASNHISIKEMTSKDQINEIKLYSAQGRLMKTMKYSGGATFSKINIDNELANGQYYLSVKTNKGVKVSPVIIMR